MDKKEVIRVIRYLKKSIKNKEHDIIRCTTPWDIHEKYYEATEIAARYLRRKGYNIKIINQSLGLLHYSQYLFSYVRYNRYVVIKC